MKLTRQDIFEKDFTVAFRGYSQEEVDEFLDQVLSTVDGLERENAQLKKREKELLDQLVRYQAMERSMNESLSTAQRAAGDIVVQAERQKEEILSGAMAQAAEIQETAQQKAQRLSNEAERLYALSRRQVAETLEKTKQVKATMLRVLAQQQRTLEDLPIDQV